MNFKQRFSKCATMLALAVTLGQTMISPVQVFASELEKTEISTVQSETSESQTEQSQEAEQSASAELPTIDIPDLQKEVDPVEVKNLMDQFLDAQPRTGSGYTSDGNILTFSLGGNPFLRDIGNSHGKLTKYYSETMYISTPFIEIAGIENGAVWCVKPDAPFPMNAEYAMKIYGDKGVYNILYYAIQKGFDQPGDGYIDTFVALNGYLGHSYQGVDLNAPVFLADPNVAFLRQKAIDQDAPNGHFDIENKVQTADFDVAKKIQTTKWYTPTFDGSNVTYDIPTNEFDKAVTVELSDGTSFSGQSGTKTVPANVKFRLTAPANYTKRIKFTVNTNQRKQTALMFDPVAENVQSVVKPGVVGDPLKVPDAEATFFARLGNLEFQKLSEFSNLPMEGVTYKVEEPGKAAYEMKTNAEGKLKFNDVIHGTKIDVTEVANPIGWVLDPTTYSLTAEAGETLTKSLINSLQMGRIKGLKNQRVLDTVETKKQGTPVYKYIPLAGAEFDLVAENDILLPDGKTVYVKAGTVVDTVVTDENGYFESTKDFLIGSPNFYRLVETNVPEGFRPPSEDQTLFSIPNGNNTEKLIVYDMGTINNDLETGKLKFLKQDLDDLFGISGAQFTVEMMSGLYAGTYFTFTTKATGNEFELPAGDWKLTEVVLPIGYVTDPATPQTQWVTIKDNETIELKWNNKKTKPVIQTKAHTADGSQTFTHGDVLAMYDDVSITHDTIDGTKGAFETLLYAILPDGTKKMIWKSDMIDYMINDKKFVKTVVTEKVDTSKYPEGTYFSFKEINYDDKGKEIGRHNDDLTEKSQSIYPKETPATPSTPTKTGTLPSTGETIQSAITMIGLAIAAAVGFLFVFKKAETDNLA